VVAVPGGIIFYQPYNANGTSKIEFFNPTDNSFRLIGHLMFGKSVAVALPVHGITCQSDAK
jgi:hypothetical protein